MHSVRKEIETLNVSLHFEWSVWILTFATNLWATGLIFIRAWYVVFGPTMTFIGVMQSIF